MITLFSASGDIRAFSSGHDKGEGGAARPTLRERETQLFPHNLESFNVGKLRKIFIREKTYFITFRAESGLPLPTTPLIERILKGIICKSQQMYECNVVAFKFMANHVHMIITVTNPETVDDFICYIKRESAHAINRLLGRRKRTVWCAGYDSPIVLDLEKLIDRIAYIYTNCSESDIADSIDDYAGFSSWQMFLSGEYTIREKRLCRASIPFIGTGSMSIARQARIIEELEESAFESNTFTLSPYAFMNSFEMEESEAELKDIIIAEVRRREEEFRRIRRKPLRQRIRLMTAGIYLDYSPVKFGKRMICHSSSKELRVRYISWYKNLCEEASYLYRMFREKACELVMPPGMFLPGGTLSSNVWFPTI